jgi:hypothetical protein
MDAQRRRARALEVVGVAARDGEAYAVASLEAPRDG